jgi:hypothetical protein
MECAYPFVRRLGAARLAISSSIFDAIEELHRPDPSFPVALTDALETGDEPSVFGTRWIELAAGSP